MPLIIRDELLNPPTWIPSFRDLTLFCNVFLELECLIESDAVDLYYRWVKSRGGLDFVAGFVNLDSEEGLRLDRLARHPRTVVTDRIAPANTRRLVALIAGAQER